MITIIRYNYIKHNDNETNNDSINKDKKNTNNISDKDNNYNEIMTKTN